jgi:hypothetical protein
LIDDKITRKHEMYKIIQKLKDKLTKHISNKIYNFIMEISSYYISAWYEDYKLKIENILNKDKIKYFCDETNEISAW